jgi:ribose 5-phosphate isomerase B
MAMAMVKAWLGTRFAGGRHQRRLDLIHDIEKKYSR